MILLLSLILVVSFSFALHFPLCEENGVICVAVKNETAGCSNCHYLKVQDAIDSLSGEFSITIYLVGSPYGTVRFSESISIVFKHTPEDFRLKNSILVYPSHSIEWENSGTFPHIVIQSYWWRVSGSGGYLEILNLASSTANVMIDVGSASLATGVMLDNFVIKNYDVGLFNVIKISSSIAKAKGILIEDITFYDTGIVSSSHIQCDSIDNVPVSNSSFVHAFGPEKLMWFRQNDFSLQSKTTHDVINRCRFTIERNYFYSRKEGRSYIKVEDFTHHPVYIFENVFDGDISRQSVVYHLYAPEEVDNPSRGNHSIFNNLVIIKNHDTFNLDSIYEASPRLPSSYKDTPPPPWFIYNNIIESTLCVPIAKCEVGASMDVHFAYNHQSNSSCFDVWDKVNDLCNETASIVEDQGNNTVGDIPFQRSGEKPYPYYEPTSPMWGMTQESSGLPIWPSLDYEGRTVPDGMGRNILGPSYPFRYPLCDESDVFCVEVNDDYPCANCETQSIQYVINNEITENGGCTIYLVGSEFANVSFTESIGLTSETPENITKTNTISVYPNHKIIWTNEPGEHIIEYNMKWWRVTGVEGYLELHPYSVSAVRSVGGVIDRGGYLEHVTIIRHSSTFIIELGVDLFFLGFMMDNVKFVDGPGAIPSSGSSVRIIGGSSDPTSSFTTNYGEGKRIWIRNCEFFMDTDLYFEGMDYTLESNYFETPSEDWYGFIQIEGEPRYGLQLYNNIFVINSDSNTGKIVRNRYDPSASVKDGTNRIYNNLVVVDDMDSYRGLITFEVLNEEDGMGMPPYPWYVYNNLIEAPDCVDVAECGTEYNCSANVIFRNNYQSNSSCVGYWGQKLTSSCNLTASHLEDDGDNDAGTIPFTRSGDKPSPYYELTEPMFSDIEVPYPAPLACPANDFMGRTRPDSLGRLSMGFLEFRRNSYPLCDEEKTFCVEASDDPAYLCENCHSKTIQEVVDSMITTEGGYTIYLVGYPDTNVSFVESVVLNTGTPEDFELANTIAVYPSHKIFWESATAVDDLIDIDSFWWRITGEGGYLELSSDVNVLDLSTATPRGAILEYCNIKVINVNDIQIHLRIGHSLYGFLMQNVKIWDISDNLFGWTINVPFQTSTTLPLNRSFTNAYGMEKRIWIRNCEFLTRSFGKIGGHFDGTIESNLFLSPPSVESVSTFIRITKPVYGVQIYNNIFETHVEIDGPVVLYDYQSDPYPDYRVEENRFYNNLVIGSGSGSVKSIVEFIVDDDLDGANVTSLPFLVYNNLIHTDNCLGVSIAECDIGISCGANVWYQDNRQTSPSCGGSWESRMYSTCNMSISIVKNESNSYGPIVWEESGDYPYPYYALEDDVFTFWPPVPPFIYPSLDMEGKSRQEDYLNRTSLGPYESGDTYYALCDEVKSFCVELDPKKRCKNCHAQSIQSILDNFLDESGGYTIYLVGGGSLMTNYSENVVIDTLTPEDITQLNTIRPYPGHSIRMVNPEGTTDPTFTIHAYWWRITGEDAYFELVCDETLPFAVPIISSLTHTNDRGFYIDHLTMKNYYDNIPGSKTTLIKIISTEQMYGMKLEYVSFEDTGVDIQSAVHFIDYYDGPPVTSSFSPDGLRRFWVQNCNFSMSFGHQVFYGHYGGLTVDSSYFHIGAIAGQAIFFPLAMSTRYGLQVFNNVFQISQTNSLQHIVYFKYDDITSRVQEDEHRFYNNLVFDPLDQLSRIIYFEASGVKTNPAPIWYVYNNIFSGSTCVEMATCLNSDRSARIEYQYNRQTQPSCENQWDNGLDSCNLTISSFTDLGHNTALEVNFTETGDYPYPYFELLDDVIGMSFDHEDELFVLPSEDYKGRPNPGPDLNNRSSAGPSQFICPSQCLGGAEGRIDCQTETCGCLMPYFGDVSCQFTWDDCPCSLSGNCTGVNSTTGEFTCVCKDQYSGKICDFTSCFGKLTNDTDACSSHGDCNIIDVCSCHENYYGEECNVTTCFGFYSNASDSSDGCGVHGTCTDFDHCSCDENYYGETCNITICYGKFTNGSEDVCTGHGNCDSSNNCSCFDNSNYFSQECERWRCFGFLNNDTDACSRHGSCDDHDQCRCLNNYTHDPNTEDDDCSTWKCFDVFHDGEVVCSGYGDCISPDVCECDDGYDIDADCGYWECFEISRYDEGNVCDDHGECVGIDECVCSTDDYVGDECDIFTCFNISSHDTDNVCNGHGSCVNVDSCLCAEGYEETTETSPCSSYKCFGVHKDVTSLVCSGRGSCEGYNLCNCSEYEGTVCETWSCGDIDKDSPDTCSGNGECVSPNICDCKGGFKGDKCETNILLGAVMAPILSVAGIVFILAMLLFLCCVFCCGVCCLILVCVSFFTVLVLFLLNRVQKMRMKKFTKLENFDLLLQEQRLEQDSSVAHLKINKTLFIIPFDEIETISILGQGGSNSVVFKAKWNGQIVAFKCFKTRMLMSSQHSYDEFEKEVGILASLSHPGIIRFFGATMKKPRVGIVMEYASKGEILNFIRKFREESGKGYPLFQKLRMMTQICRSVAYLHSRSIIHRDIKAENILINENEDTKLMDFGLSRLVDRMSQQKTSKIGTSYYMAPEIVAGDHYTEFCDVFSFAILMYILLTEDHEPYGAEQFQIEIRVANNSNFRPDLSRLDSDDVIPVSKERKWIKKVIKKCWEHDPTERYSFAKLVRIFEKKEGLEEIQIGLDKTESSRDPKRGKKMKLKSKYERMSKMEIVQMFERKLEEKLEEIEKLKKDFERMKKGEEEEKKDHETSEEDDSSEFDDF